MQNRDEIIISLQDFLHKLKANKISKGEYVDLSYQDIRDAGAIAIANALLQTISDHNWPPSIHINLSHNNISDEGLEVLSEVVFQSGGYSEGMHINLSYNAIGNKGAKAFAKVFSTKFSLDDMTFDLSHNTIGDVGAKTISYALLNIDQRRLRLNLENNSMTERGISFFADNISHMTSLTELKLTTSNAKQIANINNVILKNKLRFDCFYENATVDGFAQLIKENRYPANADKITLCFQSTEEAETIANVLTDKQCPEGLGLNFMMMSEEEFLILIQALQSGLCPQNIKLNFFSPILSSEIIFAFANALQSGLLPNELEINLSIEFSSISDDAINALKEAITEGKMPNNSKISFMNYDSDPIWRISKLASALKFNCPIGFTFDFEHLYEMDDKGIAEIVYPMMYGSYPENFTLSFAGCELGSNPDDLQQGSKAIVNLFQTSKWSHGLKLNLSNNSIRDNDAMELANIFASGNCPQDFEFDLSKNQLSSYAVTSIFNKLQIGQIPKGLKINLSETDAGDVTADIISKAIMSGTLPEAFEINLSHNKINVYGAQAFATAISSGNCPDGLKINLEQNPLGEAGVTAIAEAMRSNTSVVDVNVSNGTAKDIEVINYCCKRNALLYKYKHNKMLTSYIKKLSHEAGFDITNHEYSVPSLEFCTQSFFASNKDIPCDLVEAALQVLPKHVLDDITVLEEIQRCMLIRTDSNNNNNLNR